MRVFISVLLLLGLHRSADAGVADFCNKDTGGTCRHSDCVEWRNASCVEGACLCDDDTCARDGHCILPTNPEFNCPKDTGGTCSFQECLPFRHATCQKTQLWLGPLNYKSCQCEPGRCAYNGVCRDPNDPLGGTEPHHEKLPPVDACNRDTGFTCGGMIMHTDCPDWTGATCDENDKCSCPADQCAIQLGSEDRGNFRGASCVKADVRPDTTKKSTPPKDKGVALILSGGGAKGAYEYGVLKGICNNELIKGDSELSWVTQWTKVFGISIGALNAAGIAQFPFEEQCTKAMEFLSNFWTSIKDTEDVFIASTASGRKECLSSEMSVALENAKNFKETGGLCNSQPGGVTFQAAVTREAIQNSGMQLRVAATNMNDGDAYWWNETSPDIVFGAMASGRLAPLLPPMVDGSHIFIDGGFISNTPIMQAIEEGAKKIFVVYLASLAGVGKTAAELNKNLGVPTITFISDLIQSRMGNEITIACNEHPDVQILAHIPEETPGSLTAFDEKSIADMIEKGEAYSNSSKPKDLCVEFGLKATTNDVCAMEGEKCDCKGTVYYGRSFRFGRPGSGVHTTFDQMKEDNFTTKHIDGPFTCGTLAMGDPLKGYYKYCYCDTSVEPPASEASEEQPTFHAGCGRGKNRMKEAAERHICAEKSTFKAPPSSATPDLLVGKMAADEAAFQAPEAANRRAKAAEEMWMTNDVEPSTFEETFEDASKKVSIRDMFVFATGVVATLIVQRHYNRREEESGPLSESLLG